MAVYGCRLRILCTNSIMIQEHTKDQESKSCIKDWELREEFRGAHFHLEVDGILQIVSEVDAEECRKLLRAVVQTWINLQLARSGVPAAYTEQRKRERLLLINRARKDQWEWCWILQEAANLYNQYEGREAHQAILVIMGNRWRFESSLKSGQF